MNDVTKTPEVRLTPATDLIRALERIRLYGNAAERYEGVEDYDPVLKFHCRL